MSDEEPSVPGPYQEAIEALLTEVKGGIEATVVGIFDGARSWLHASSEKSPGTFWTAFNDIACLQTDWGEWDRELLDSGTAHVDCRCGAHSFQAFMFNGRWILIVLATGSLFAGAQKVIDQALEVLKRFLPASAVGRSSAPPVGGGSGGGGQGPAELGIPIKWIKKRMAD